MIQACDALDIIRTKNRDNPEWINRGLYRLLYNPTLHIMAYERLKSKPGNMTPGTDGKTLDGYSVEDIQKLVDLLRSEQYWPTPVRRVYIPKKAKGKYRPQTYPKTGRECRRLYPVYGGHQPQTSTSMSEMPSRNPQWEVRWGKSVFDPQADTSLETVNQGPSMRGSHRHGCVNVESPVYQKVDAGFGGRRLETQVKLCAGRLSHFVITGNSKALLGEDIEPGVLEFVAERGLSLSAEKTKLTDIEEGFDFLGQNVRKYKGKLLIKPSQGSVKAILSKIRQTIRVNPWTSAGHLILLLNPLIRGWVNYHRHVVSKDTFNKINHEIVMALWRWARKRHRNKSARWIKVKYFGQSWVFNGQMKAKDGSNRQIYLFRATKVPIKRHVKVRAVANPYDPEWEYYFERRLQRKMADKLKGKRTELHLWLSQNGICPVCEQLLTADVDWEQHHIIQRVHGGPDTLDNLALLHPTCHRQVHWLGLTVLSPRPTMGR